MHLMQPSLSEHDKHKYKEARIGYLLAPQSKLSELSIPTDQKYWQQGMYLCTYSRI